MPNDIPVLEPNGTAVPDAAAFLAEWTSLAPVPFVPEVRLHMADDVIALWEAMEQASGAIGLPPPFWAFPWAGGVAVARHVLDHPELVAGRRVLDLAAGSGLVAIAAARCGAAAVRAVDIDRYAVVAMGVNAEANRVEIEPVAEDILDGDGGSAEVVLAGDVFYERAMAERFLPFLERAQARGAQVIVGDPGRAYLPRERFTSLATYRVPVVADLEDAEHKATTVWQLNSASSQGD